MGAGRQRSGRSTAGERLPCAWGARRSERVWRVGGRAAVRRLPGEDDEFRGTVGFNAAGRGARRAGAGVAGSGPVGGAWRGTQPHCEDGLVFLARRSTVGCCSQYTQATGCAADGLARLTPDVSPGRPRVPPIGLCRPRRQPALGQSRFGWPGLRGFGRRCRGYLALKGSPMPGGLGCAPVAQAGLRGAGPREGGGIRATPASPMNRPGQGARVAVLDFDRPSPCS